MIREAYTILAMDAVRIQAVEYNQTAFSYFASDSASFCDLVFANGQNKSSILYAGLSYCDDIDTFGHQIYGKGRVVPGAASPMFARTKQLNVPTFPLFYFHSMLQIIWFSRPNSWGYLSLKGAPGEAFESFLDLTFYLTRLPWHPTQLTLTINNKQWELTNPHDGLFQAALLLLIDGAVSMTLTRPMMLIVRLSGPSKVAPLAAILTIDKNKFGQDFPCPFWASRGRPGR